MPTFSNIGLAEPSTITKRVASVRIDRGGTNEDQEIMVMGDPESSIGIARVLNTTPSSTDHGLVVRQIGSVRSTNSVPADFRATVYSPSTLADLTVRAALSSTNTDNPVSAAQAGAWTVRSTNNVPADLRATVYSPSTLADLTVAAAQSGNWSVRVNTSSGGSVEGSTTTPAGGSHVGLHVRQVFPVINSTTVLVTSTNSTALYALVSSAAARQKVFAFLVTSTHTNPSTLVFVSSNGNDLYHAAFGSGSSGITGVSSPGITPPGFLFATAANEALNVRIEGGSSAASTVVARVSFSYFTEA